MSELSKLKGKLIEKFIELEIKKLKERYNIQQKEIDDAGVSEDDLGNMLSKAIEQYPVLDRLWVREQLWSRIRGLEEIIQIIQRKE